MKPARRASGLLDAFASAGVLDAAEIHIARTLSRLAGELDERVLLAAALAVRATRLGSVCVDLHTVADSVGDPADLTEDAPTEDAPTDAEPVLCTAALPWPDPEDWRACSASSPLVDTSGAARRPLHLEGSLLYLDRYWQEEHQVRAALTQWARRPLPVVDDDLLGSVLGRLFPGGAPDLQRLAAAAAAAGWFTVVAGGPGTGKTTTVARLLVTLAEMADRPPRIALAAPTGKAAARLREAVDLELARLYAAGLAVPDNVTASTVHRLLGARPDVRTRFWRNRSDHLPHDVVVIDEASMLSLTMVARVLEALRPDARLVLVGDPDQLVSVEAGAVLGDLAHRPPRPSSDGRTDMLTRLLPDDISPEEEVVPELRTDVVRLRRNHRFQDAVALVDLSDAVRNGDADAVVEVLRRGDTTLEYLDVDAATTPRAVVAGLRSDVVDSGREIVAGAREGDAGRALTALARHRLLCAHRQGPYGVARWRDQVHRWLVEEMPEFGRGGEFYVGRPLLVTANDYELGLFNGDTGVVILRGGHAVAAFGSDGPIVPTSRLSAVQTPHAMTVHKAQGSEATRVTVVLPPPESPLLTRELLYTAITRARSHVRLIGTEDAVRRAVTRPVVRASGLRRGVDGR